MATDFKLWCDSHREYGPRIRWGHTGVKNYPDDLDAVHAWLGEHEWCGEIRLIHEATMGEPRPIRY